MRKVRILIVAFACMLAFSACEEKKVITVNELPASAQTYIKENYAGVNVTYVKMEKEAMGTKYDVRLDNGIELEFDGEGVLEDVDTAD